MHPRAQELIEHFQLTPHPEGGYYKEVYRSSQEFNDKKRNYLTSIYFLLVDNEVSHFHRIKSDECWYFHEGEALSIHSITPDGRHQSKDLGLNVAKHEDPFHLVPAGTIFGSHIKNQVGYALVSCAVSPGFHFDDFELFTQDELSALYPQHDQIIRKLTP
jgi:hypothetical protein